MESSPAGYSEADIMDDAVISAQEANYGLERVVDPYLVQTSSGADVNIPDYWNASGDEDRYLASWTWEKANEPRYGNETAWLESSPAGYSENDIFDDSVIAAQQQQYGLERVVAPYLVQSEADIRVPDYWNDTRYQPTFTWEKANEPRYGNESAWMESSPAGYSEQDIMSDTVIANTEAQWGQMNTAQPFLVQRNSMSLAQNPCVNRETITNGGHTVCGNNGDETLYDHDLKVGGNDVSVSQKRKSFAQKRTYPEWDSQSYISPYSQRDNAWTVNVDPSDIPSTANNVGQYDFANETHWVGESAVDGYKIPITADDADQFFAQKEARTYPEWDSQSYISPYSQRDHAWTVNVDDSDIPSTANAVGQYDFSNETHWVGESAVDGYKIPITADDADQFFFAQKQHRTYPEWDSQSYISPYSQRDNAWTVNVDDSDIPSTANAVG